ncbi:MAG: hypothetical protein KAX49_05660 [Halanaerobiales bacterium]|nr:hypothetical protein [Halanaerobiales bacterium]
MDNMNLPQEPKAPKKKVGFKLGGSMLLVVILVVVVIGFGVTTLDRNDIGYYKVVQTVTGNMIVRSTPGYYVKWINTITTWKEADTLYWSKWPGEGQRDDTSIDVRFADGGVGYVSMNVRYMMPAEEEKRLLIQKVFKNNDAFQLGAIEQMAMQASQIAASMMTAEGSYRNKPQFMSSIIDQVTNGLYETRSIIINQGENDSVTLQEIVKDENGLAVRKPRDLETYNVKIVNVNVTDIDYEKDVQEKINQKREKAQEAELAKYEAEKSRQDTIAAEEMGRKQVMVAKYEEEQKKIRAEIQAEQEKQVAEIEAEKNLSVAELDKQKALVELETEKLNSEAVRVKASAEAEAKKKLIEADGALQQKLDALIEVNRVWSEAYTQQRPTPDIIFGAGGGENTGMDANAFMQMLMVKTAQDLNLNLDINK